MPSPSEHSAKENPRAKRTGDIFFEENFAFAKVLLRADPHAALFSAPVCARGGLLPLFRVLS